MTDHQPTMSHPSVCPLDCPDTCSLTIKVRGDRIVDVKGSDVNPFTAGVICNKVARCFPDYVHGQTRLRHPLKRTGARGAGSYAQISWDEALDLVHDGFSRAIEQHGPQSVLPLNYAGPHGELAGASMDRRFFYKMGATLLDRGPLCGGVRGAAYESLFGAAPGMPPEQVIHSDLILVWGNNVTVSNLHFMRVLKQARAAGARVVVIDPKRIKLAEQCDLHLQLRPGTDVVLGLGLAAELERRGALDADFIAEWTLGFEDYMSAARAYTPERVAQICGIPVEGVLRLVDWIAGARNLASAFGNGIERTRSGGAGLRAAMALNALTGQHGRLGAGIVAKSGATAPKTSDRLQGAHLMRPGTRCFNIVDVAAKMLDRDLEPPVAAAMIYNHNPVATHPDQEGMIKALMQEEIFVVGSDVVMTDSMALCDVILPAASHFEYDDIYGAYGQNYLQRATPVIAPVGESLPNTEIFRRLAARFGYLEDEFQHSDLELIDQAFDASSPVFNGTAPSDIPVDAANELNAGDGAPLVMCKTIAPRTGSGRIELFSQTLEDRYGCGVPRYAPAPQDLPLVLITPSSDKRTNATFGDHPLSAGAEVIEVHPQDAAERGLTDGEDVTVWNAQGQVTLVLKVSTATRPGVAYSPKGTWLSSSKTGRTANVLIPSVVRTDIADGACYNETFVDLRRASI
ncbi:MAG: molybdopterin-dependent oxidoreductase [Rhodobacteraceae bacterium]|nr:molybdopterin-dependent oxidoreductase [Paracoccaceae bacterium]